MMRILLLISAFFGVMSCDNGRKFSQATEIEIYDSLRHRQCRSAHSDRFVTDTVINNLISDALLKYARNNRQSIGDVMRENCFGYIEVGNTYCVAIFAIDFSDAEEMYCYRKSDMK